MASRLKITAGISLLILSLAILGGVMSWRAAAEGYLSRGNTKLAQGDISGAQINFLSATKLAPLQKDIAAQAYVNLAALTPHGSLDQIRYLEAARELNTENIDIVHRLAAAKKAAGQYQAGLNLLEQIPPERQTSETKKLQIALYIEKGDISTAILAAEDASAQFPATKEFANLAKLGEEAIAVIKEEKFPLLIPIANNLVSSGQSQFAEAILHAHREQLASIRDFWLVLANAQLSQQNIIAAAGSAGNAERLDPPSPDIALLQAKIAHAAKDQEATQRFLEKAKQLGATDEQIEEANN